MENDPATFTQQFCFSFEDDQRVGDGSYAVCRGRQQQFSGSGQLECNRLIADLHGFRKSLQVATVETPIFGQFKFIAIRFGGNPTYFTQCGLMFVECNSAVLDQSLNGAAFEAGHQFQLVRFGNGQHRDNTGFEGTAIRAFQCEIATVVGPTTPFHPDFEVPLLSVKRCHSDGQFNWLVSLGDSDGGGCEGDIWSGEECGQL